MYSKLKYWKQIYKTQSCQIWWSVSRHYDSPYLNHEIPPLILQNIRTYFSEYSKQIRMWKKNRLFYNFLLVKINLLKKFVKKVPASLTWLEKIYIFLSSEENLLFIQEKKKSKIIENIIFIDFKAFLTRNT